MSALLYSYECFRIVELISSHCSDDPMFTLAKDLGTIKTTTESTVFTVGVVRDSIIQYNAAPNSSAKSRHPFYETKYDDASAGVSYTTLL